MTNETKPEPKRKEKSEGAKNGPEHVIRTRQYITDASYNEAVGRAHGRIFSEIRPASTMIVVAGLLDPRWKVEMEADAWIREES